MKVKELMKNFKFFGLKIYILKFLSKICKLKFLEKSRRKNIYAYISKHVFSQIENIELTEGNINEEKYIFTLWWDGIESAPKLVQSCIKSLNKIKGYKLVVLDKNNYFNYVQLSENIKNKVDSGKITITHLSDIIRVNLLSKYICVWADATIFVSKDIDYIKSFDLFTLKCSYSNEFVSNNLWSGFFMANSIKTMDVFKSAKKFFDVYWDKYDCLIDYFLIDYVYLYLYKNNSIIRESIDRLPVYDNIYVLSDSLHLEYNEKLYNELLLSSDIHKLSWKKAKNIKDENNILKFLQ